MPEPTYTLSSASGGPLYTVTGDEAERLVRDLQGWLRAVNPWRTFAAARDNYGYEYECACGARTVRPRHEGWQWRERAKAPRVARARTTEARCGICKERAEVRAA